MRIYVGNIPYTATEADLRDTFSEHGAVSKVDIVTDRDTGRPRGFAFVDMDDADAQRAIQELNGQQLGGRTLNVNIAKERAKPNGAHQRERRGGYSDWQR